MNRPSDDELRSLLTKSEFSIWVGHMTGVLLAMQTIGLFKLKAFGTALFMVGILVFLAWSVARNQGLSRRCKNELYGEDE